MVRFGTTVIPSLLDSLLFSSKEDLFRAFSLFIVETFTCCVFTLISSPSAWFCTVPSSRFVLREASFLSCFPIFLIRGATSSSSPSGLFVFSNSAFSSGSMVIPSKEPFSEGVSLHASSSSWALIFSNSFLLICSLCARLCLSRVLNIALASVLLRALGCRRESCFVLFL